MRHPSKPVESSLLPSRVAERVLTKMALLLDCHRAHLGLHQRLAADLDFTPLEQVQVALDFEHADGCSVSLDDVARAVTVQDLVNVIEEALHAPRRARLRDDYVEWLARGLGRGTMKKRSSLRAA